MNNALDQVNVRRLVLKIKEQLEESMTPSATKTIDPTIVAEAVDGYLEHLKGVGALNSYTDAKVQEVVHTWKSLYPRFKDRVLARLAYKLSGVSTENKQRWYHTIAPYKIEYEVTQFSDMWRYDHKDVATAGDYNDLVDAITDYEVDCVPYYRATLAIPHTQTVADFAFVPVKALRTITLQVHLTKGVVTTEEQQ